MSFMLLIHIIVPHPTTSSIFCSVAPAAVKPICSQTTVLAVNTRISVVAAWSPCVVSRKVIELLASKCSPKILNANIGALQ